MGREQVSQDEFKEHIIEVLQAAKKQPGRMNASLELIFESCSVEPDITVEYIYNVKELHKNPYNWVHGGVIASLMDYAIGAGAVAYTGHLVATTDMSTSFVKAMIGDKYRIQGEFTHVGRNRLNGSVKMFDYSTGVLCATSQVGFAVLKENAKQIV
ncbi:MAG: PaaI family thioesterase [Hornefia sp.]|nr:PaaI family thioesterase [Hornefia sp.]